MHPNHYEPVHSVTKSKLNFGNGTTFKLNFGDIVQISTRAKLAPKFMLNFGAKGDSVTKSKLNFGASTTFKLNFGADSKNKLEMHGGVSAIIGFLQSDRKIQNQN